MKKNKMMRLASILLVCVLLTTSVISGTFAKYVTSDSASDTARVAKWGVTALASGNLFGSNYYSDTETGNQNEISATVKYNADAINGTDNIVAPGTQNSTGITIAVSGQPEVANTVAVTAAAGNKDIYLKEGSYATLVKAKGVNADNVTNYYVLNGTNYQKATAYEASATYYEAHDAVTFVGDYYPIIWTLDGTNYQGADAITNINSVLGTKFNKTNNANVDLNTAIGSSNLTWKWTFYVDDNTDGKDTILGNIAAAAADQVVVKTSDAGTTYAVVESTDYCTEVAFGVTISVTQVD